jgi:hypothetical protein
MAPSLGIWTYSTYKVIGLLEGLVQTGANLL